MSEPFSLLLPVYAGDDPDHLEQALRSSVHEQTRRPDELVVVRDGPLPRTLAERLDALAATCPVPVVPVDLPENVGLARALEAGLAACSHELVARMDADDVSLPQRFAVQLPLLEAGADLVGSALLEFAESRDRVVGRRVPPTDPAHIARYARFHDPFNHPTVVYRRGSVAAAGGYQDLPLMEDYWLFARMIAAGVRVANVAEPLVLYRVGAGAYARRGGWRLLRSELALQRRLRRSGFTTRAQYARNVVVRGGYRFVPLSLRRLAYRRLIATRAERRGPAHGGPGPGGPARGGS